METVTNVTWLFFSNEDLYFVNCAKEKKKLKFDFIHTKGDRWTWNNLRYSFSFSFSARYIEFLQNYNPLL